MQKWSKLTFSMVSTVFFSNSQIFIVLSMLAVTKFVFSLLNSKKNIFPLCPSPISHTKSFFIPHTENEWSSKVKNINFSVFAKYRPNTLKGKALVI